MCRKLGANITASLTKEFDLIFSVQYHTVQL